VRQTLEDLLDFASLADDVVGREYEQFMTDRVLQIAGEAVITRFGGAASRLPEPFRKDFPEVPWKQIVDMRSRLVHLIRVTDPDQVWNALARSVPELIRTLGLNEVRPKQ
jgi:uncharacterized protein with HEPN domain